MKGNIIKIFWGLIVMAVGGLSIADQLGYISYDLISGQTAAIVVAVISAAFLLSYFLSAIQKWGWLFPALFFAALALTINMILEHPDNSNIALPILLSFAIPFYIGYALNRRQWRLLIPAWILTVISVIPQLTETVHSDLIGPIFLYATALPFLIVYLGNRQRKWSLITTVALGIVGTLPLVDYFVQGDIVGTIIKIGRA